MLLHGYSYLSLVLVLSRLSTNKSIVVCSVRLLLKPSLSRRNKGFEIEIFARYAHREVKSIKSPSQQMKETQHPLTLFPVPSLEKLLMGETPKTALFAIPYSLFPLLKSCSWGKPPRPHFSLFPVPCIS